MAPSLIQNPDAGLLRFITCGSVDDGKSTLIGRLLLDSKAILADALDTLERTSLKRGARGMDLSLLTDGLQAEREQGITIDVAYRYFATGRRKFILGDAPGHEQYTRNMVTAASTADLAIILVDARKGVLTQTRRHTAIAHLLGIRHLVMAINKMDLVDWSEDVFAAHRRDGLAFAGELGIPHLHFIPISALEGDGVVERGGRMPWYQGPTLMELLETVPLAEADLERPFRFPVQWVCRPRPGAPRAFRDFRGYGGRVASGAIQVGDRIAVLPGQLQSRVRGIRLGEDRLEAAQAGQSVTLELEDELDVARGDLLADPRRPPALSRDLEATLCWFAETPARAGARFLLHLGTREVRALLQELRSRLEITTLKPQAADQLAMNDLAEVRFRLQAPAAADPYADNRATGAFIVIDETTNATVAGGLIRSL
jgi:sulfate adenylyltransferase subunit 1